jgi:circadian clock protein KaiC
MKKKKVTKKAKASTKRRKKSSTQKASRVPSGIQNLDRMIQGGFEKNSTNLLVGQTGSGKSIFLTQFLVEGIKKGEKSLFISFEEKKEEFYSNIAELGIDLGKLEKEGKFFFLEYTPQKVNTMLEEGGGEIEAIVLTKKVSRIAIDSMTSFMMLFEKELEKKEAVLSLFSLLRSWNCTTVLSAGEDKGESPQILGLEADSIIRLYMTKSLLGKRKRMLEIVKMRGTDHYLSIHEIEIKKGGIAVNKTPIKKSSK